ncbi:MAG: retropepsin-like domain-containing protein [Duncaniella sp.]|nr:retropepsin-like domain-containing protein [Duncaniella sp.]
MRKLFFYVVVIVLSLASSAQSYDERIGAAMNRGDWFALDSIYNAAPKDSMMPFLEVFSRCLIGNRFNRPDISVPAFDQLFREYSSSLDLGNLLSSTVMFTTDLGRIGYNEQAADLARSILDATREHIDSVWTVSLEQCVSKHAALSAYKPYGVTFSEDVGRIPFKIVPVGEEKNGAVLMHLENSTINGSGADITFDTGAGVNLISDSLARKFSLIPIDGYVTVAGVGTRTGRYAIAKEVRLGNIAVSDVPFVIVDFKTGNAKVDQCAEQFGIIIGSELMLQLKDLTLDFINREITVPSDAPERSQDAPNMCFGEGLTLDCAGCVLNKPVLMNIDTGDSAYGTLGVTFFNDNKDFVVANAETDTVRRGGIGGVVETLCYRVSNMPVSMGGHTVGVPGLVVNTEQLHTAMDLGCNIGLKTLMMFDRVRLNLVDFVLTTYPQNLTGHNNSRRDVPVFRFAKERGPSVFQTIGFVAVGVARSLINPNAPACPDL